MLGTLQVPLPAQKKKNRNELLCDDLPRVIVFILIAYGGRMQRKEISINLNDNLEH